MSRPVIKSAIGNLSATTVDLQKVVTALDQYILQIKDAKTAIKAVISDKKVLVAGLGKEAYIKVSTVYDILDYYLEIII